MAYNGPPSVEVLANSTVQIVFPLNTYNFTKYVFFNTSASNFTYQIINSTEEGGEIVKRLGYTKNYNWTNPELTNYTWEVVPESIYGGETFEAKFGQVTGQTVRFDYLFNTGQQGLILTSSTPNYTIVDALTQKSDAGVSAKVKWSVWGILLLSSIVSGSWYP